MKRISITDGNAVSVKSKFFSSGVGTQPQKKIFSVELSKNISRNCHSVPLPTITASQLIWDRSFKAPADSKSDVIIAADCLFCAPMHQDLLHTIAELMHENSVCILVAPKRKGTLDAFVKLASETARLDCAVSETITTEVDKTLEGLAKSPFFKLDEHKPYLIRIILRKNNDK